jgi:hypothetical protein
MLSKLEKLKAHIQAVNLCNDYCNYLYDTLSEFFKPYIGKKILKADNSILVKVKEKIPYLKEVKGIFCFENSNNYHLSWSVQSCINVPSGNHSIAVYHNVTVYIGNIEKYEFLGSLLNYTKLKTDYNYDDVVNEIEKTKKLKNEYENQLRGLGEFSNYV